MDDERFSEKIKIASPNDPKICSRDEDKAVLDFVTAAFGVCTENSKLVGGKLKNQPETEIKCSKKLRHINQSSAEKKWKKVEEEELILSVGKYGKKWKKLAKKFGRSVNQVRNQYIELVEEENIKPFTQEEKTKIQNYYSKNRPQWKKVSTCSQGTSANSLKDKFYEDSNNIDHTSSNKKENVDLDKRLFKPKARNLSTIHQNIDEEGTSTTEEAKKSHLNDYAITTDNSLKNEPSILIRPLPRYLSDNHKFMIGGSLFSISKVPNPANSTSTKICNEISRNEDKFLNEPSSFNFTELKFPQTNENQLSTIETLNMISKSNNKKSLSMTELTEVTSQPTSTKITKDNTISCKTTISCNFSANSFQPNEQPEISSFLGKKTERKEFCPIKIDNKNFNNTMSAFQPFRRLKVQPNLNKRDLINKDKVFFIRKIERQEKPTKVKEVIKPLPVKPIISHDTHEERKVNGKYVFKISKIKNKRVKRVKIRKRVFKTKNKNDKKIRFDEQIKCIKSAAFSFYFTNPIKRIENNLINLTRWKVIKEILKHFRLSFVLNTNKKYNLEFLNTKIFDIVYNVTKNIKIGEEKEKKEGEFFKDSFLALKESSAEMNKIFSAESINLMKSNTFLGVINEFKCSKAAIAFEKKLRKNQSVAFVDVYKRVLCDIQFYLNEIKMKNKYRYEKI